MALLIAADVAENIVAVWRDGTDVMSAYSVDDGRSWSDAVPIYREAPSELGTSHALSRLVRAQDGSLVVVVTTAEDGGAISLRSSDGGRSWTDSMVRPGYAHAPALIQAGSWMMAAVTES